MTGDDVVASLNRWGKVSPYGAVPYKAVSSVTASGNTVVMKLTTPQAPLLPFLAFPVGGASIMPKEIIDATGSGQLKQYIGTGPYKFVEWAPDRFVHHTRFDQYAARTEPGSNMAGRKDALADDIYYYPVSQVATRIAGVQSGDYDIADQVSTDAYAQLKQDARATPGTVGGAFITFFFNKRQGIMANQKLRQAVAVAMDMQPIMQATFGAPELFSVDPSIYPKGTPWYTTAGANWYNVHNTDQAKALAKEAGYSGQPIRWLTTQEYDYMFKTVVVASTQLQQAGFNVDMQVVEWATLLDRRAKADQWDMFVTSHSFVPDPSLITVFSSAYPGWWDTPDKNALFAQFNAEVDPNKRSQLWAKLQTMVYQEVPIVRPGGFSTVLLTRKGLPGYRATAWIVPWNVQAAR
jgi:peptide/nickel transport system substrate-binding protein